MILVTGGTGLVGMHLLLSLTAEEEKVRAIYRAQDKVDTVAAFFAFAKATTSFKKIEWVKADIRDIHILKEVFQGVDNVYHCAALISFDPYDFRILRKTNIQGTANVVNACLASGVSKICYLSSIATLASTPHNPITEENYWDPDKSNSVYGITKHGAEMEVWRATQEGLPAVILNPGIILGEGNYEQGSGELFSRVNKGLNYYSKGSSGVVDVKDVVRLMIQALRSPIENERFIVVGDNWSYERLLKEIAKGLGVAAPKRVLTTSFLKVLRIADVIRGAFTRKRSLTKSSIQSVQEESVFSNAKLKEYFDYIPTEIGTTIDRVSEHFKSEVS